MCGINGFISDSFAGNFVSIVNLMNDQLRHRGPDEGGTEIIKGGAIGMRRLSIIDIAHGHQPMHSTDGRYCIVFNGEIYDYKRTRSELQAKGVAFSTHADTEVLLNSFIVDGPGGLDKINGMFAFAIADCEDRSITLVRDRAGIKPLYYHLAENGDLTFSSELGSLVANPSVPRTLDQDSLRMFLVDRYVADPFTFFAGVRQLPPGEWLKWTDGKIETGAYWQDQCNPADESDLGDATSRIDQLLLETIESQMVADVPVGVFLSGGIDSSTVAAYAAKVSSEKIHTFSVGFADARYDESAIASRVAGHIGSEHHEIRVEDRGFDFDVLARIVRHVGQPVADASCIPMMYLSDFTVKHVKVALSGDGGDEYFGGYNHINWAARVHRTSRLPLAFTRSVAVALMRGGRGNPLAYVLGAERMRRIRKGLEYSLLTPAKQMRYIMSLWTPPQVNMLVPGSDSEIRRSYEAFYEEFKSFTDEEMAMRMLANTYMPGAILTKVDRMSMAASLEVRVPLLDNRITEFARTLPLDMKIRNGTGKHLLREAGRKLLPGEIYTHPKQGFSIPLAKWLNDDFWSMLETQYRPGAELAGLFDQPFLRQTIADGKQALQDTPNLSSSAAASRVWALALLGCWFEQFDVSV